MLSTVIKLIILVILLALVAWIALSVYSCFNRTTDTGLPDMPDPEEVTYSVYVENSGNLLLTDDYEVHGVEVGKRIFILHSFWELSGQKFKFKNADIVLDEAIFGVITIKRR